MKTFNTLLFIQNTDIEGQNQHQEQAVIQQGEIQEHDENQTLVQVVTPNEPVQSGENTQTKSGWTTYLFIALIIVVFYIFMIRPQSKRAKEERKFREALKKGDKIVTVAGIHGKIVELEDTTAIIETEGQGKLKIEKAAIAKHQSA